MSRKEEFIIMRVPKRLKDKIGGKAKADEITVSKVCRDILEKHIDSYEEELYEEDRV